MTMRMRAAIEPSATVAVHSLAVERQARGERVYNLSAGEPFLPSSPLIVEAAKRAMEEGRTHYPPVRGIVELREAASGWMNAFYATQYSPDNTIVTCGGKFGIFALCQAFIGEGDEVVIIAPYWVSYPEIVKLFGGMPRIVQTSEADGWKASADAIERLCTRRTRMLIVNNASNPTGVVYGAEELRGFLDVARRHDLVVVSDEVYSGLVYQGSFVSCGSFADLSDNVCVIQSCSKHFAMTGWRVGFVFGPTQVISTLAALQSQATSGTSSISQWAALAALQNARRIMGEVNAAMQRRRDLFHLAFGSRFGRTVPPPASGLYAFVALDRMGSGHHDAVRFCRELLAEAGVAALPGDAFGRMGYARFAFGQPETEIEEAVQALGRWVKQSEG